MCIEQQIHYDYRDQSSMKIILPEVTLTYGGRRRLLALP